jgi:hypothetical protein
VQFQILSNPVSCWRNSGSGFISPW